MTSLIIHGHFYQPPRENPWTGVIDREESAAPFDNWNERILAECYRANGFARIIDSRGRVERIVNNYTNLSFNFGPTLLSWLEVAHPATYARILAADRESVGRHNGHGNALGQGYNHAILPLCNPRDRLTQVLWGIADFRHRFGRSPEALWLPETACNDDTLGTLIDAGLTFAILSPNQAQRVRAIGSAEWRDVADGRIDARRAYRYFHRDGSGRSIAIFFYDDALARAVAFEGALVSSRNLLDRVQMARVPNGSMVNVATDGETFGHHFPFGERCIAHALEVELDGRVLEITNYGEYLERHPALDEVEIKPGEGTAWSCVHGVGRWYQDCGCQTGGPDGWNQAWRGPLRWALDLLRDHAARSFEEVGGALFRDPWKARDEYIDVVLNQGRNRREFLDRTCGRHPRSAETVRVLSLLEMQRAAMLMYTSCGWFFADISGIETVQVMKYAGRVLDFMDQLELKSPRDDFFGTLAQAMSNLPEMGNGADVYRRFAQPSRTTPRRIAAHLAISSLADYGGAQGKIGDYSFRKTDYRRREDGRLALITSRILLTATNTGQHHDYLAAALHLGGLDFYCTLGPYPGDDRFKDFCNQLWEHFPRSSLPILFRIMQRDFGPEEFGLEDVLPDGRRALGETVFGYLSQGLTGEFARLYEQEKRIVDMLGEAGFDLPPELRLVTEYTLGRRFEQEIRDQLRSRHPVFDKAIVIAEEISRHRSRIDKSVPNRMFSELIGSAVRAAVADPTGDKIASALEAIATARRLQLQVNLDVAQEALYQAFMGRQRGVERLMSLAVAVGLSRDALMRGQ